MLIDRNECFKLTLYLIYFMMSQLSQLAVGGWGGGVVLCCGVCESDNIPQ